MDFEVAEVGENIVVRFTPPSRTTEDLLIPQLRAITLYAGPGEADFSRDRWSATARPYQIPVTAAEFTLPAADWVGQELVLALRTTGHTGKESDWSNYGYLSVAPPLRVPGNIVFANAPDAITLKWTGNAPRYRILRSTDGKFEPIGETEMPEYEDRSIAYGVRYEYRIVGLAGDNRQSLPSQPAPFTPSDAFAPATPMGLTAIAAAGSIELSWGRSTEDDLAGYNIYRASAGGPFESLAQKIALPTYVDTRVEPGRRYRYTVSAVDTAGNESGRSMEAASQVE
jgi:hypothetical protein